MSQPFSVPVAFQKAATFAALCRFELRTDDDPSPVAGSIWFRTDTGAYRGYNGTTYVTLGGAGVAWDEITGDQSLVNISGFTNDAGFIDVSSVTWENLSGTQATHSLSGFNNDLSLASFTNDTGFIDVSSVTWENLSGTQSSVGLSGFNNDATFVKGASTTVTLDGANSSAPGWNSGLTTIYSYNVRTSAGDDITYGIDVNVVGGTVILDSGVAYTDLLLTVVGV